LSVRKMESQSMSSPRMRLFECRNISGGRRQSTWLILWHHP
jgi:hypothetical protein